MLGLCTVSSCPAVSVYGPGTSIVGAASFSEASIFFPTPLASNADDIVVGDLIDVGDRSDVGDLADDGELRDVGDLADMGDLIDVGEPLPFPAMYTELSREALTC